ncbi:major vault protein [Trypanosoma rangeli]|uniref:Major vault protein n=1 Tax=Trypanosoma rangeli TaxID=5698 RepID=A0A422NLE5_TRYRA|nr:major vault protein [Trypanosoma rangeli]RNF06310.1 major vault protein [Trypanosoma rangeli]|eukprot:RNF06310.1 major vault protein [Trypanosoma rangeli]
MPSVPTGDVLLRLRPYEYAHVVNENTNTTELFVGPLTRALASNEIISKPVTPFHVVPHGSYGVIENPHVRASDGVTPVRDRWGQTKVRAGEREIVIGSTAFPLYPEERLVLVAPMTVLSQDEGLEVKALCNYTSSDGVKRVEGERFIYAVPGTYCPRVEEEAGEVRRAVHIKQGHAIRVRAVEAFTDKDGQSRRKGEEYLRTEPTSYICTVSEEFVGHVSPIVLHPDEGLHVKVLRRFVDEREYGRGVERLAGQTYFITHDDVPLFLLHPYEKIVLSVKKLHVSKKQYAVVVNKKTSCRRFVTDASFYLQLDEFLDGNVIHDSYILNEGQAILLKALEDFEDTDVQPSVQRRVGDVWLLHGPREYVPNAFTEVCKDKDNKAVRERIILTDGNGIYVRNIATGEVRSVNGPVAYMLDALEELWEKNLSPDVERCLAGQHCLPPEPSEESNLSKSSSDQGLRGKTHWAVMYRVPYRSVTQVYNYKALTTRTIFGPERVLLEPDEEFTLVTLSGSQFDPNNPSDCPAKEINHIKALHLFLGPSNMRDIVNVETRDHAQLALQLCYAWYFDVAPGDELAAGKCFSVSDFVADTCSFIAGRIRAAVASLPFQQFHKNSGKILQEAVFGVDPVTRVTRTELRFAANNFVVTSVDTQRMEVLDARTREGLQKSVKIAIEITTQAQESKAQQIALAREQHSRGLLERQKIQDRVENEIQRRMLLEAEAHSFAVQSSGRLHSVTDAAAKAASVEHESAMKAARIHAAKDDVTNSVLAEVENQKRALQHDYESQRVALAHEIENALADIENQKFAAVMEAIGPETVMEIAKAGPELQAKLLESLGLEGYLVMDGSTPINLFRTAAEMSTQPSA